MERIQRVISLCDSPTRDHQKRVSALAVQIGQSMGLSSTQIENIRLTGLVHDIGKVILPAEFASKTTDLTPEERQLVKGHPQAGFDMLRGFGYPNIVMQAVLQHHEHLDGSGYPNGLTDNQILLEAKIVSVADVVDAISSNRPYNPALDICDALGEIARNSSRYYDPAVVEACMSFFSTCMRLSAVTVTKRSSHRRRPRAHG